ncbi:protein shisa-4-like [Ptychodera flava]|uniref:protein shisa-4-like n=1 Tax=Ptychodera flava TaxID=63121 RepID=UPI00396A2C54
MADAATKLGLAALTLLLSLNGIKCDYCYGNGITCPGWFQDYTKSYCCGSGASQYCCDHSEYYGSLSGGVIAGIVIGVLIFITVVVASIIGCVCFCSQANRRPTTRVIHNQVVPTAGVTVVSHNQSMMPGYGGYGYGNQQQSVMLV